MDQVDTLITDASNENNHKLPDTYVKLFVGQIPKTFGEDEIRGLFQEYGNILDVSINKNKLTGEHRGCAFVTFASKAEADNCIAQAHNMRTLPGMKNPLQVKYADGEEERLEHKLFIGMLPKTVTEADITEVFGQFGKIEYVSVLRGPNDVSKGCAFLKYSTRAEADAAIAHLNGTMKFGSTVPIAVRFADTEKKKREKKLQQQLAAQQRQQISTAYPQLLSLQPQLQLLWNQQSQSQVPTRARKFVPMQGVASQGLPASATNNQSYFNGGLYGIDYASALNPQGAASATAGLANPMAQAGFGMSMNAYGGQYHIPQLSHNVDAPQQEGPPGANLFIYHIPQEFTDMELRSLFASYGNVISSKVFIDKKTGQSKCFGFVSYDSPEAAQAAITALNGYQVSATKRLKVQIKRGNSNTNRPY